MNSCPAVRIALLGLGCAALLLCGRSARAAEDKEIDFCSARCIDMEKECTHRCDADDETCVDSCNDDADSCKSDCDDTSAEAPAPSKKPGARGTPQTPPSKGAAKPGAPASPGRGVAPDDEDEDEDRDSHGRPPASRGHEDDEDEERESHANDPQ